MKLEPMAGRAAAARTGAATPAKEF